MTPAADIRTLELFFADTQAREKSTSQNDVQFLRVLKCIHLNEGGQLEMPLPFKTHPFLSNKNLAVVPPKHLKRKPDKDPQVFNCLAKYKSTALSDHLLTGPDLTNGLTGVLCHFRKDPITGCANYGLKYLASMNEKVVNRLMKEIQAVCSNGKLHFHKYISNSREVLEFNSVCDCTVEVKNLKFSS